METSKILAEATMWLKNIYLANETIGVVIVALIGFFLVVLLLKNLGRVLVFILATIGIVLTAGALFIWGKLLF